MRTTAFLRVRGDEKTIRAIENQANITNARIKKLRAKMGLDDEWWDWETYPIVVDSWGEAMVSGLIAFLKKYRPIFPTLRSFSGPGIEISLQVMTDFVREEADGDFRQGLYLSYEGIALLGELGAALEYDFVPIM
jgi:hypothetical protein